ncbi:unnamed protein product, partial [Chrysoparadoxa australica]
MRRTIRPSLGVFRQHARVGASKYPRSTALTRPIGAIRENTFSTDDLKDRMRDWWQWASWRNLRPHLLPDPYDQLISHVPDDHWVCCFAREDIQTRGYSARPDFNNCSKWRTASDEEFGGKSWGRVDWVAHEDDDWKDQIEKDPALKEEQMKEDAFAEEQSNLHGGKLSRLNLSPEDEARTKGFMRFEGEISHYIEPPVTITGFVGCKSPTMGQHFPRTYDESSHLSMRVRGDGRKYSVTIQTQSFIPESLYRQTFDTKAGVWQTISIPWKSLIFIYRGFVREVQPQLDIVRFRDIGFGLA